MALFLPDSVTMPGGIWVNVANMYDGDNGTFGRARLSDTTLDFPQGPLYNVNPRGWAEWNTNITGINRVLSFYASFETTATSWDTTVSPFWPRFDIGMRYDGVNPLSGDLSADWTLGAGTDWQVSHVRQRAPIFPGEAMFLETSMAIPDTVDTSDLIVFFDAMVEYDPFHVYYGANSFMTWTVFDIGVVTTVGSGASFVREFA